MEKILINQNKLFVDFTRQRMHTPLALTRISTEVRGGNETRNVQTVYQFKLH